MTAEHPQPASVDNDVSVPSTPSSSKGKDSLYRKVYKGGFGFTKSYNFPLYVIFGGAMLGFSLSRLKDYDYDEILAKEMPPGQMWFMSFGSIRVGMILHLAGILPAGILVLLQFTPAIRHRAIWFHRINGYVILLLCLLGNVGACMVLRYHDSGTRVAAQVVEGFLTALTSVSLVVAWYNVRRLQIDQHRAWMLRSWAYFGTIVSSRIITYTGSIVVSRISNYYTVRACDQLGYVYEQYGVANGLATYYPQCLDPASGGTTDGRVIVKAGELSLSRPEMFGAALSIAFEFGLWLSTVLHILGVELYLAMTPRETARLRQISYERQLQAGFKNPGDGGLTTWRLGGDADQYDPNKLN
ncbi:DUF2306 domain-containing protein [Microdochium nivale]|nr:DUF2306 domain-containing protein [Microdochium nivale]